MRRKARPGSPPTHSQKNSLLPLFFTQALSQDLLRTTLEIPFSVPPYMSLLARSVATLEGIALLGDPNYQMVAQVRDERERERRVLLLFPFTSSRPHPVGCGRALTSPPSLSSLSLPL